MINTKLEFPSANFRARTKSKMAADTEWWYKNKDGEKTGESTGTKWCGG